VVNALGCFTPQGMHWRYATPVGSGVCTSVQHTKQSPANPAAPRLPGSLRTSARRRPVHRLDEPVAP
jgi:hypothetical protein